MSQQTDALLSVHVANVASRTTDAELMDFFKVAEPKRVSRLNDKVTGHFRGVCFIAFADEKQMKQACELDGKELNGKPLRISPANSNGDSRTNDYLSRGHHGRGQDRRAPAGPRRQERGSDRGEVRERQPERVKVAEPVREANAGQHCGGRAAMAGCICLNPTREDEALLILPRWTRWGMNQLFHRFQEEKMVEDTTKEALSKMTVDEIKLWTGEFMYALLGSY